ncbi:MAG: hypothetical protein K8T90_09755 [Planctomycetes bacterium]|nr:hypothetical protein [Planctomycetota bacterium]
MYRELVADDRKTRRVFRRDAAVSGTLAPLVVPRRPRRADAVDDPPTR